MGKAAGRKRKAREGKERKSLGQVQGGEKGREKSGWHSAVA